MHATIISWMCQHFLFKCQRLKSSFGAGFAVTNFSMQIQIDVRRFNKILQHLDDFFAAVETNRK
jgi:hypothetical protein